MPTIRELIADLQAIENPDQPYIGFIRIAEDFEFYDEDGENELIQATTDELAEIATWRGLDREIDYALMGINDLVYDAITNGRKEKANA